jgi:uncharacterized protein YgbK (DUF1537 family)
VTLVVIDDDPTGAQTLRDLPLLFGVDEDLLRRHLDEGSPAVCVLTNSRSLSAGEARSENRRVAQIVRSAAPGDRPLIVSRGDSTLRGHLAPETAELAAELYPGDAPRFVFAPAFVEAGRTTVGGVHYVAVDGTPVPAAETPFSRDARFPYRSSDLRDYLVEVGAIGDASEATVVTAGEIAAGPAALTAAIVAGDARWIVADAVTSAHLDAIADGIRDAHAQGAAVIVRCAPSLVRALASQDVRPALTDAELAARFPGRSGHGLVVVGSHVPQTTAQLAALREELPRMRVVEVPMEVLLGAPEDAGSARERVVADTVGALATGDVVLATPRAEVRDTSADGSTARSISDALSDIVTEIAAAAPLAWVIAKGGITSHETAARGLGIRAATVVGQLFDSTVSVVLPTDAPAHVLGMPYVIFPGNVGAVDAVAAAVRRMTALTGAPHHRSEGGER